MSDKHLEAEFSLRDGIDRLRMHTTVPAGEQAVEGRLAHLLIGEQVPLAYSKGFDAGKEIAQAEIAQLKQINAGQADLHEMALAACKEQVERLKIDIGNMQAIVQAGVDACEARDAVLAQCEKALNLSHIAHSVVGKKWNLRAIEHARQVRAEALAAIASLRGGK